MVKWFRADQVLQFLKFLPGEVFIFEALNYMADSNGSNLSLGSLMDFIYDPRPQDVCIMFLDVNREKFQMILSPALGSPLQSILSGKGRAAT